MEVEARPFEQILKDGRAEYLAHNIRTHHNMGKTKDGVYDLRKWTEKEEENFCRYTIRHPELCLNEATDKTTVPMPFIDLDSKDITYQIPFQRLESILYKNKLECIVLLDYGKRWNFGKAHIIFQNNTTTPEKVKKLFENFPGYDAQCSQSLRMPFQYKAARNLGTIQRIYKPFTFYRERSWYRIEFIGKEFNAIKLTDEIEWYTEWNNIFPIYKSDNFADDIPWDFLKCLYIRTREPAKKEIENPRGKIVCVDKEKTSLTASREIAKHRFIYGPQCEYGPFNVKEMAAEVLDYIDKYGGFNGKTARDNNVVEIMNRYMVFIVKLDRSCAIGVRGWDPLNNTTNLLTYTEQQCKALLETNCYFLPSKKEKEVREEIGKKKVKKPQKKYWFDIWKKHSNRRTISHISFLPQYPPNSDMPPELNNVLNSYTGLAFTTEEMEKAFYEESGNWWADKFQKFIFEIICDKDLHTFGYILQFINFAIKRPGENPQTVIYIYGSQGIGKSQFMAMLEKIFGIHAFVISSFEGFLRGEFNSHLEKCIFMIMDEFQLKKENASAFKRAITTKKRENHGKFQEIKQVANYFHIIGTGNKTPDELSRIIGNHEPFQRRLCCIKTKESFNKLLNPDNVFEVIQFMLTEEVKKNKFEGIKAWTYQFFAKENVRQEKLNLYTEQSLNAWTGGSYLPWKCDITCQNLEISDQNIVVQYLDLYFTQQLFPLMGNLYCNPLFEFFWGYPDDIYDGKQYSAMREKVIPLRKLLVKKDLDYYSRKARYETTENGINCKTKEPIMKTTKYLSYVFHKDYDASWSTVICLEKLVENIITWSDKLKVRNPKTELTVNHILDCFKKCRLNIGEVVITTIPKAVIKCMNHCMEHFELTVDSFPQESDLYKISEEKLKVDCLSFLYIGDKQTVYNKMIQLKNQVPTNNLQGTINDSNRNFERLYGGEKEMLKYVNMFDLGPFPDLMEEPPKPSEISISNVLSFTEESPKKISVSSPDLLKEADGPYRTPNSYIDGDSADSTSIEEVYNDSPPGKEIEEDPLDTSDVVFMDPLYNRAQQYKDMAYYDQDNLFNVIP